VGKNVIQDPLVTKLRRSLDRTRQVAPQVVEHLRARILSLELAPGTPLSRVDLQNQFGTSQTPVRDALMRLEEEGLVTVFPQYTTIVSRIDLNIARQMHFMRRSVEQEAVYGLTRQPNTADVAQRLLRTNAELESLIFSQDDSSFLSVDRSFHAIIYEEAGLQHVWNIILRHSGHIDRLRRLNLPNLGKQRIVDNHRAIIEGMMSGHARRAEEAVKTHLSGTLAMVDRIAELHPDFVEAG